MKSDVMDNNDPMSCYEVKCQETLHLPDWWRQTKRQAKPSRNPILVFTQAYRPFYYTLLKGDWEELVGKSLYAGVVAYVEYNSSKNMMDRLGKEPERTCVRITLDDDECVIVKSDFYLEVKKDLLK